MQLLELPREQLFVLGFMIFALIFSLSAIFYYRSKPDPRKRISPKPKVSPKSRLRVREKLRDPVGVPSIIPKPEAADEVSVSAPLSIREALSKTRQAFSQKIDALILSVKTIDDSFLSQLEELLYTSDLGPSTVEKLLLKVREKLSKGELTDLNLVKKSLLDSMVEILNHVPRVESNDTPQVILVVGVNGVGKTTSIGKLAYYFSKQGKKVMVVAADTFRAAAQEQLQVWATRAQAHYYTTDQTTDPAAVAFQGIQKAVSDGDQVVIIDTAGRLHNKENLMKELKKIKKVIQKLLPGAPHQTLLVIDANSGQNAIQQAKLFNETLELSGLIVTKLDGSAKGGVIVGIAEEVGLSPGFVGVGEKITDLEPFSADEFAKGLLEV